jgi:hypothetical protein
MPRCDVDRHIHTAFTRELVVEDTRHKRLVDFVLGFAKDDFLRILQARARQDVACAGRDLCR